MKRIIAIACMAWLAWSGAWADNISAEDIALQAGETKTVDISLMNTESNLVSFQIDLTLPEGISINKAGCSLSNRFSDPDQVLAIGKQGDNVYRLATTSFALTPISGTSGTLLTLSLTASANSEGGTAMLSNIRFITSNSERVTMEDTGFNITLMPIPVEQTLTLEELPAMTYGDEDYTLPETTEEGLTLTWESDNTAVAILTDNILTIKGAGTVIVTATQEGTDEFLPFSREYTLTIGKAALTITANDCTKVEGEENPELTVSFEGFVNDDDASVLTQQPTITTEATTESPVGSYSITVNGAEADNYDISYVTGTLTVLSRESGDQNVIWEEDWSGYAEFVKSNLIDINPNYTFEGTVLYDDGTFKSGTTLYAQSLAGGDSPELLISKNGGSFTVAIDLGSTTSEMTLSFKSNYGNINITAEGAEVGEVRKDGNDYSCTITPSDSSITLTFTNNLSSNVRTDNFKLIVGTSTAGLSWGTTAKTVTIGEENTFPVLQNDNNLPVNYSSSDPSVATINSSGEITLVAAGTTIITASFAGNSEFAAVEVSYELTVNEATVVTPAQDISVAQALELIYALGTDVSQYVDNHAFFNVSGYIVEIEEMSPKPNGYGDATFTIAGTKGGSDVLKAFRCKDIDNADFIDAEKIKVDDFVVVTGLLHMFVKNGVATPEITNCHLVSINDVITFEDSTVKQLCVQNWDTNGDGELSEAEAAAVTDLGEVFKGNADITSFDELQYFTGLTSIGAEAFYNCDGLTSVNIPNSVTSIGYSAFEASGLTAITIPNSVTRIGGHAFLCCYGLTSVNIPNSVTSIGNAAFFSCGLTSITIPNSVTSIEDFAFFQCSGLTSITIPNSVTSIGDRVFELCTGLTSITIPNSITSIGHQFFAGCTGLTSITIPNSVTSIGSYAFRDCTGLTSITIPNSMTSIGEMAFYNCTRLTSVIIPNSVTNIGYNAFNDCSVLISVTVEIETPLTIDENTFSNRANATLYVPSGCKAAYEAADYWKEFKEIVEPSPAISFADANVKALCVANWDTNGDGELSEAEAATVTSLGQVFKGNEEITSFDELQYFTGLTEIADHAFNECKNLESVILPSEVTRIGHWSFATCWNLKSFIIPASVSDIGAGAFAGCINMIAMTVDAENTAYDSREDCNAIIHSSTNTVVAGCKNMTIPEGVTSIGDWALNGMGSLTSVVLPSSLTSIGTGAFSWCWSLPSITIPANVTSIGGGSFEGCDNLTSVTVENPEPVAIGESTFSNRANATLYVPSGCKAAYEAADYWKEFKEIVEIGQEIEVTDISQLDNAIYVDKANAFASGQGILTISLKNAQEATAYQFNLKLPEGVTLATNDSGDYVYTLSERLNGHSVSINYDQNYNVYKLGALSGQSHVITGNDGVILTLRLNVAESVVAGSYPVIVKDAKYSLADGSSSIRLPEVTAALTVDELQLGDVNGDSELDIADAVCIVNHIIGKPTVVFMENVADANLDEEIDIADAVRIVNLIIGKISTLSHHGIGNTTVNLPEPE